MLLCALRALCINRYRPVIYIQLGLKYIYILKSHYVRKQKVSLLGTVHLLKPNQALKAMAENNSLHQTGNKVTDVSGPSKCAISAHMTVLIQLL